MLDVEVWDVKGVLVELLVLQARGHVLHLLHFPRTEHMRAVVHTHRTVLGGTCTNNISLKSNHKYVDLQRLYFSRIFVVQNHNSEMAPHSLFCKDFYPRCDFYYLCYIGAL